MFVFNPFNNIFPFDLGCDSMNSFLFFFLSLLTLFLVEHASVL